MNLVAGLPPGGDGSYNYSLVIVYRFSKTAIFLACHKYDIAMDTALLICNRLVSWTGRLTNIISDRYPKFNSALWTDINQCFGTKLSFSTAYHLKINGLDERLIQPLEEITRIFCEYVLKLKD
ncbi:hypothetical protein O181_092427 [Austropuccinia psidii MF-1]|uniref:Integrase catalytic domain-containing protein n=1 Tax=Austropuccinia psidii MF-1 TaxID=1389203 RepID=A0A9Q3P9J3_9BASI|nr:hypothetical protein [Austropuccinia psidii MF-1]